jgi:hypothetical protein
VTALSSATCGIGARPIGRSCSPWRERRLPGLCGYWASRALQRCALCYPQWRPLTILAPKDARPLPTRCSWFRP